MAGPQSESSTGPTDGSSAAGEAAEDRSAASGAAGAAALSHRQILAILPGLMLGMFLAALSQTVVSTATRAIADELHGLTAQAWITTAYLITGTIATPLYGKLSDVYGRRPIYLIAIALFTIGSLLCGMAGSVYELAAYRAVQGLGGGGLMTLTVTIIADITSPRERGRYTGYFMAVFATASVLGPVVGGFFVGLDSVAGVSGWRWLFLINVPLAAVAVGVVLKVLKLPRRRVNHRIDYLGAAMLVVALLPLLTIAERGREWGWGSGLAVTMYLVGGSGLVAFIFVERKMGDEALLPPRLFANPTFTKGNLFSLIIGIGMFGTMITLPLYLQIVQEYTPTEAGLAMVPVVVGMMAATITAGRIMLHTARAKLYPVLGSGFLTVALALFSRVGVDTPLWHLALIMVLTGAGLGLCMQSSMIIVQNEVPPRDMGVTTASVTFFRQNGGTLGAAAFLSVLFAVVAGRIDDAFRSAAGSPAFEAALRDPDNAALVGGGQGGVADQVDLDDTSFLHDLAPALARPFLEGFSSAISTVFATGAVVMVVAFILALTLKNVRLKEKSALQQIADEEAATAELAKETQQRP